MTTTKDDIREWLKDGQNLGYRYMMICTDTFNWKDYPVFCKTFSELSERYKREGKVMECYDLELDWEAQVNEKRSWHPEERTLSK